MTHPTQEANWHDTWNRIQAKLRFQYGEAAYNSWFRSIRPYKREGSMIVLALPTRFMREWVMTHYLEDIRRGFEEESNTPISIELVVRDMPMEGELTGAPAGLTEAHSAALAQTYPQPSYRPEAAAPVEASVASNGMAEANSQALDPRFTFENFVVGATNELAYAAAQRVANTEGAVAGGNPLFLYGGVGLGKTHLMHAIGWQIRKMHPNRRVLYLSAEKFMYQFVRALRDKDIVSFKEYFRSVDVLMVDDIQFICGKNNTQEEFFHTFNALVDAKKQLVLSGDRSPSALDGLEERVRSRLGWGLVIDINTTTFELRLGILQSKLERMNIAVPTEVLEFLARKITSNVRELEGALNKVVAHSQLMQREITLENCQHILRDLLSTMDKSLSVDDIKARVAEHHNIRVSDMHSARRARHIARPRQIAMYLAKRLTTHSLPEIGRKFGGKDHTTVMHAVKRVEELCAGDADFNRDVQTLMRALGG